MNACRYSHVLAQGFLTPTPSAESLDPSLEKASRRRTSRAQKKVSKTFSIASLPMQNFAAPKLLQQMMVELHGLASSVPVIVAMESSTQAEIISVSLATLFTDIGVHLMAFYFATSQVFEMMQPIMNAIMSCAKSKSHRVVLRTFSFWRPFVDRLVSANVANSVSSSTLPQDGDYNGRVQRSLVEVSRLLIHSAGK